METKNVASSTEVVLLLSDDCFYLHESGFTSSIEVHVLLPGGLNFDCHGSFVDSIDVLLNPWR